MKLGPSTCTQHVHVQAIVGLMSTHWGMMLAGCKTMSTVGSTLREVILVAMVLASANINNAKKCNHILYILYKRLLTVEC